MGAVFWIIVTMVTVPVVIMVPLLMVEAATNPERFARLGRRMARRLRPNRAEVVRIEPVRPIEQVALELRRLGHVLTDPGPVSAVRRLGVEQAYEKTLIEACAVLSIEQRLGEDGVDRQFERLRVEAELQQAGLALRDERRSAS